MVFKLAEPRRPAGGEAISNTSGVVANTSASAWSTWSGVRVVNTVPRAWLKWRHDHLHS